MLCTSIKFFTRCHEDEEAKLLGKIWAFLEKNNDIISFVQLL